jgi:hypothetical protein
MMNNEDPELPAAILRWWPYVWPFLGGLGGAIVSLGLARNEGGSAKKKAFNVLSGTIVAVFLGPLIVRIMLGAGARADSEMVGAIYCIVGLCATSIIELIVRKVAGWLDRLPIPEAKGLDK